MPPSTSIYDQSPSAHRHSVKEGEIEYGFIGKLQGLKYEYCADIRDRAALERNFREKFEALNRVKLSDGEFARPLDEIVTPDVFTAAKTLRSMNAFTREDGTPLNYTLVNIKDWCKNTFEVVNQLRINTDYYLGFKKPCVSAWSKKLDLLFDTDVEQTEIQKFSDDASHLQSLDRALQQPDFVTNAQNTVKKVIQALKAKDLPQYTSMCKVIGVTP